MTGGSPISGNHHTVDGCEDLRRLIGCLTYLTHDLTGSKDLRWCRISVIHSMNGDLADLANKSWRYEATYHYLRLPFYPSLHPSINLPSGNPTYIYICVCVCVRVCIRYLHLVTLVSMLGSLPGYVTLQRGKLAMISFVSSLETVQETRHQKTTSIAGIGKST